jgi:hemoglobin
MLLRRVRLPLSAMKQDIYSRDQIETWMRTFYQSLLADDKLSHFFQHIVLEHHLPAIVNFWCFVLLDEEGYTTNVFQKHVHLDLKEEDFRNWLGHFIRVTDEQFEGPKADLAKQRARLLASTFYHKLSGLYIIF